jgi:glycosyltransferase involved in cell wall biosynthesis
MPPVMRLLCLLNGGPEHPSTRFRVVQHLERLGARGFEVDVLVAKRSAGYDLRALRRRARQAEVILLQKKLFAPWKLRLLPGATPVVFDFDDALFAPTPEDEERLGERAAARRAEGRARRLRAMLSRARKVIAGNRFLAAHAGRFARDVVMLPTGIDLAPFPEEAVRRAAALRRRRTGERLIGWIGSRPSLRYLPALAAPLRAACARVRGARLVQVCDGFIDLPGVPTEKRPWSREGEAADLMGFDVGLMPIDDRPFARGKCGLKILQYQAAGVPVVGSPFGANLEIVLDGETGLLVAGAAAWEDAIVRVLSDPVLARRLGEAGRRRVEAEYSAGIIGERLADEILEAARPARARPVPGRSRSGRAALPGQEGEEPDHARQNQRLLIADHLAERPSGRVSPEGAR